MKSSLIIFLLALIVGAIIYFTMTLDDTIWIVAFGIIFIGAIMYFALAYLLGKIKEGKKTMWE